MNMVVGVSGGVDSVVLLDILVRQQKQSAAGQRLSGRRLIVAHVDHGIRSESGDDEAFVKALANQYQLPYSSTSLQLGESASEEQARDARYEFLFALADEHQASVVTAHHQDDVIGSMVINLARGTGWRGLAVMNRPGIERPLIGWTKQKIYDYATQHRLEWVEDATNASPQYLRNRLRQGVIELPAAVRSEVLAIRSRQIQLAHDIDYQTKRILRSFANSRYHYSAVDNAVAVELLRARFAITIPQAERALLAIKTARPGAAHVIDGRRRLKFTKTDFIVE